MTQTALRTKNCRPAVAETEAPRVDVLESDHGFTVLVDLPGVLQGDVDVQFENGELTVVGQRKTAKFARTFRLNDQIAADKIEAELKDGVLHLTLPKIEAIKPRKIAVRG